MNSVQFTVLFFSKSVIYYSKRSELGYTYTISLKGAVGMNKRIRANFFLLTTAFIWGAAFVAQKEAMSYIGPFTFTCVRMLLGGAVLIPVIIFLKKTGITPAVEASKIEGPVGDPSFLGGFFCGVILFFALTVQQIGLVYTTAGKAGFITAMYIIIVPVLGIFMKKRISKIIWLCVILAIAGLYLLCMEGDFTMNKGDALMIFSAFGYAMHIITVDRFSPIGDPVKISCIQFFVCGALCFPTLIVEAPALTSILESWLPILYTGVLSCGVAYTFQVVAQRDTSAAITAIILSFESVFAVLMGFLLLSEIMSLKEITGCALMFAAIILAQAPDKPKDKKLNDQEDSINE